MATVLSPIHRLVNGESSAFDEIEVGDTFNYTPATFAMIELLSLEEALDIIRDTAPDVESELFSEDGWLDLSLVGERNVPSVRTHFWEPGLAIVIGVDRWLRLIFVVERSNGIYTLRAKRFPLPN